MKKKFTFTLILLCFASTGCFAVNHAKLSKQLKIETNRYETLKSAEMNPGGINQMQKTNEMLAEARIALKRWDHERARTLLDFAGSQLDLLTAPPETPQNILDLYSPLEQPFTPEPEFP